MALQSSGTIWIDHINAEIISVGTRNLADQDGRFLTDFIYTWRSNASTFK